MKLMETGFRKIEKVKIKRRNVTLEDALKIIGQYIITRNIRYEICFL